MSGDLKDFLERRIGVQLASERRESFVEPLVSSRLQALGLSTEEEYVALLAAQPLQSAELSRLVSVVTNPFTFFFRDTQQFDAMRSIAGAHGGRLRVWSAGCATGEEPYSLAMLFADMGIDARILATDINQDVLKAAREGSYRDWSLRHLPADYRERFFEEQGEMYRLVDNIRRRVTFRSNNLIEDRFPEPGDGEHWDWILCRNVLFYFDRAVVEQVARSFAQALCSDGWLFLSTTENLHGLQTPFSLVQERESFAYRLLTDEHAVEPALPAGRFPTATYWAAVDPGPSTVSDDAGNDIEETPSTPLPTDAYRAVIERLDAGDQAAARAMLERVVSDDPKNVVAWTTLGNLYLLSHEFEEAIEVYQIAQVQAPLQAELHHLQGLVYRKLGDLERAARSLRHALFLQPSFWCASFLLAGVNERLGKTEVARRNLAHTVSVLDTKPGELFSSYVKGIGDVELDQVQVIDYCTRALARS